MMEPKTKELYDKLVMATKLNLMDWSASVEADKNGVTKYSDSINGITFELDYNMRNIYVYDLSGRLVDYHMLSPDETGLLKSTIVGSMPPPQTDYIKAFDSLRLEGKYNQSLLDKINSLASSKKMIISWEKIEGRVKATVGGADGRLNVVEQLAFQPLADYYNKFIWWLEGYKDENDKL
jgi:hypothetical protein